MTILDSLYQQARQRLTQAGAETSDLDARLLIMAATGLDQADFITGKGQPLSDDVVAMIEANLARRIAGEPVSRILGVREFWGLEFEVTPDTLDPRADTETLVEMVLAWVDKESLRGKALRLVDLGTGTGCILIALLSELPKATGVAVDFSHKAALVAQRNAKKHGLADRFSIIQGDWMSALKPESFDLIVSNPPYIPNPDIENLSIDVKNHDPILSLSGGNDGLNCYKKIISELKIHLNKASHAFLEIGFGQLSDLSRLVDESSLCLCDSEADIAGIPRVVDICRGDK